MEQLYCAPCTIHGREDREAYTIFDGKAVCYPCFSITVEQIQRDIGIAETKARVRAQNEST